MTVFSVLVAIFCLISFFVAQQPLKRARLKAGWRALATMVATVAAFGFVAALLTIAEAL